MVILNFYCLVLPKSAISRGFQTTATPLHNTSRTNPATYCDKTGLHHPEEVKQKTTAHRRGIAFCIRQKALPAGGKFNLQ